MSHKSVFPRKLGTAQLFRISLKNIFNHFIAITLSLLFHFDNLFINLFITIILSSLDFDFYDQSKVIDNL